MIPNVLTFKNNRENNEKPLPKQVLADLVSAKNENPDFGRPLAMDGQVLKLTILFILFCFQVSLAQNLHPVKENMACLWGLKNDSGQWVISPRYTQILPGYSDLFVAVENEKWGVLNLEGKTTVPFEYDELKPDYYLNLQDYKGPYRMYAVKNRKHGVIDRNGTIIIPLVYDQIWVQLYSSIFHISRDNRYGLRNYEKELLPCRYTTLQKAQEHNLYIAGTSDSVPQTQDRYNGKNIGVITVSGDTIVPFRFSAIGFPLTMDGREQTTNKYSIPPSGALIIATCKEGTGLYSQEGKCLLEPKYNLFMPIVRDDEDISHPRFDFRDQRNFYSNEPVLVMENDRYGIAFPGKGLVQPAVYESITLRLSPGKRPAIFQTVKDGKQGLLHEDGTDLLDCEYPLINFYCGRIFVTNKEGLIEEYDWRNRTFRPRQYQKILTRGTSHILLISGDSLHVLQGDSAIRPCKVLASLPGDIRILDDHSVIAGKGQAAEMAQVQRLYRSNNLVIQTKDALILCDQNFKVLIHSGNYAYFDDMQMSGRTYAVTKSGKYGMIGDSGRLTVDTAFGVIKDCPIYGRLFVKPLAAIKNEDDKYRREGWAVADSAGNLLTAPDLVVPDHTYFETCMFWKTKSGVGLFDFKKGAFLIPPVYKNGFTTEHQYIVMQTKNKEFVIYSPDFKKLSPLSWKGLIHISGDENHESYLNGFSRTDESEQVDMLPADSVQTNDEANTSIEDEWLLVNGNKLVILGRKGMVDKQRVVLDRVYQHSIRANYNDGFYKDQYHWGERPHRYRNDCPRLDAEGFDGLYQHYRVVAGKTTPTIASARDRDSIAFNDSIVMRMIRNIAPKARYILHPGNEYDKDDERREVSYESSSFYYRISYRSPRLLSWQASDGTRSRFENYQVSKAGWRLLQLPQLFKTGYETLLNAELVLAIQKADSLELDCSDPRSYLKQCDGRFSFSEEGLLLYLQGSYGESYIPQLIPWERLKSVIPATSPVYVFLKAH